MLDVGNLGVESESGIVWFKEGVCLALDKGAVSALIDDEVVPFAELVECQVFSGNAEDERARVWGEGVFPICASVSYGIRQTQRYERVLLPRSVSYPSSTIPRPVLSCRLCGVSSQPVPGQTGRSCLGGSR